MIKAKNISNYATYIISQDLKFHRKLMPGREISIPQDIYDELSFDAGFTKLVQLGSLKITGVDASQSEVIEVSFNTAAPDEIKAIYDKKDYAAFTKLIQNAAPVTKDNIVSIAIENRVTDNAFISLIQKYCGVDVISSIATQAQAAEK